MCYLSESAQHPGPIYLMVKTIARGSTLLHTAGYCQTQGHETWPTVSQAVGKILIAAGVVN